KSREAPQKMNISNNLRVIFRIFLVRNLNRKCWENILQNQQRIVGERNSNLIHIPGSIANLMPSSFNMHSPTVSHSPNKIDRGENTDKQMVKSPFPKRF